MKRIGRELDIAERITHWLLWGVFCAALLFYRALFVGPGQNTASMEFPRGVTTLVQYWLPVAVSIAARLLLVPMNRIPFLALVPLIFGLVSAELLMFVGIFVAPESFNVFFATAVVLMLLWVPIWGRDVGRHTDDGL